jgi:rhamnose transport system permease protein
MPAAGQGARGAAGRALLRWESVLLLILLGLVLLGSSLSEFFLSAGNLSNLLAAMMEIAIMALPMALIIIAAEIDLSVESMAGLAGVIVGFLWAAGVPIELAILAALGAGALGGLMNGLLVAKAGLPSLVVTLGTLALFRGMALIILGPQSVTSFPSWFTTFGFGKVPGTPFPWPFVVFLLLAVVLGVLLHRTWIGRQIYATGKHAGVARFSGVEVARLKIGLFVLSGLIAALAGIILAARLSTARADNAQGMTLVVVTVVLLGGVNIFGGSGSIPGVALAAMAVAVMQNALRLANVSVEVQSIALGTLLIVAVVVPSLARQAKSAIDRVPRGRPPPSDAVVSGNVASP